MTQSEGDGPEIRHLVGVRCPVPCNQAAHPSASPEFRSSTWWMCLSDRSHLEAMSKSGRTFTVRRTSAHRTSNRDGRSPTATVPRTGRDVVVAWGWRIGLIFPWKERLHLHVNPP